MPSARRRDAVLDGGLEAPPREYRRPTTSHPRARGVERGGPDGPRPRSRPDTDVPRGQRRAPASGRGRRRRGGRGWRALGWRRWAIPALAVVTVLFVLRLTAAGPGSAPGAAGVPGPGSAAGALAPVASGAADRSARASVDAPGPDGAQGAAAGSDTGDVDTGASDTAGSDTAGSDSGAPDTGAGASATATQPADPGAIAPAVVDAAAPAELSTDPAHPNAALAAQVAAGALPPGPPLVTAGAGTWHVVPVVPGSNPVHGNGRTVLTYTVEVEDGLQPPEGDAAFALAVDAAMSDPRSWVGSGEVSVQRVDTGVPTVRVSRTSQQTARSGEFCGWGIPLESSCWNAQSGRVIVNDARWSRGAVSAGGDLDAYRTYVVNHEVGHALGRGHEACAAAGQPAPVMMQQSWSTANDDLHLLDPRTVPGDGKVCLFNPYPFPAAPSLPGPAPAVAPTTGAG